MDSSWGELLLGNAELVSWVMRADWIMVMRTGPSWVTCTGRWLTECGNGIRKWGLNVGMWIERTVVRVSSRVI